MAIDKETAFKMRESGMSYQQIGNVLGCSHQNIQSLLNKKKKEKVIKKVENKKVILNKSFDKVIYVTLIDWCLNNNVNSLTKFRELIKIEADEKSMRNKMQGITEFKLGEIRKILEVTNMKFEDIFG